MQYTTLIRKIKVLNFYLYNKLEKPILNDRTIEWSQDSLKLEFLT